MIFESIPYTNFHDINLDWILNRMQEYMAKTDAAVQSIEDLEHYIREYLKSANMQELINNALDELNRAGQLGYLSGITQRNIRQWNPAGDGVTDDTEAFRNAITYCNEHGYDLVCNPEDTYLLSPTAAITVRCNIDFRGASLLLINTSGEIKSLLNIRPSSTKSYSNVNANIFSRNGMGTVGPNLEYASKVMRVDTPYPLGWRSSSGESFFYRQLLITDGEGKFVNVPFYAKEYGATAPDGVSDTYTLTNVHSIERHLEIKNAHLIYNQKSNHLLQFIDCRRSNVTISGITIEGYCISEDNGGNGGVIYLASCALINIDSVNGNNPVGHYTEGGTEKGGTGYILSLADTSDVSITNCCWYDSTAGSWYSQGTTNATNTSYRNVLAGRADVHYMHFGHLSFDNCTLAFEAIAGGFGDITHTNVLYNRNYLYDKADGTQRMVQVRTDLPLNFVGSISWDHCTMDSPYTYSATGNLNGEFVYAHYRAPDSHEPYADWIPTSQRWIINDLKFPAGLRAMVDFKFDTASRGQNVTLEVTNLRGNIATTNDSYPLPAGWVLVTGNPLGFLMYDNCYLYNGSAWPDLVNNVSVTASTLFADQQVPNNSSARVAIASGRMRALLANGGGCNVLMVHDMAVDGNRRMTGNAAYHMIHHNLIVSEYQAYQAEWNQDN